MSEAPLSNHITVASAQFGTPTIVVRSDGTPDGTTIKLTDETKLGLVQSISWAVDLGNPASCTVTTIANPGEMKALASHTSMLVRPAPGYHPLRYLWDWYVAKFSRSISSLHKVPVI